jgi:tRNA (guanine-N7-)-methyltransferase
MTEAVKHLRTIRSFVKRAGRTTKRQQHALDHYAEHYMLSDFSHPFDFTEIFGNDHPVIVEIGFGMGDTLVQMAENRPDLNYLGIEVHEPGVGNILASIHEKGVKNLRVINHDAIEIFKNNIPVDSLSGMQIFFPDPWHKKKHHKRRLVTQAFLDMIYPKLAQGAVVHFATDWENYAEETLALFSAQTQLKNQHQSYAPRPQWRPLTKFEQRGQRLSHGIWDILFEYHGA